MIQIGNDLHFNQLKPEYSGSYSCIARNKAGSDQHELDLTVRQKPKIEIAPSHEVSQGKILTMKCFITAGHPSPSLSWEKNGAVLTSNSKIYISPDRSQLQIFSIGISDAGMYKCVADNTAGHFEIETQVDVLQSPQLAETFEEIEAIESDQLELSCISEVVPAPEVTWFVDGSEITDQDYHYDIDPDVFRGDNSNYYAATEQDKKYSFRTLVINILYRGSFASS